MSDYNLLNKTELRIENITLDKVNLTEVATTIAEAFGLKEKEVLVTDVLDNVLTLDILRRNIDGNNFIGKENHLFESLSHLSGITITDETSICSEGMLGWIAMDATEAKKSLKIAEAMSSEIRDRIKKRVYVVSTGDEVQSGQIEDTNQPYISQRLTTEGYNVTPGPILADDQTLIAGTLRRAIESGGYGLIITTGGVGAEKKDQTVEALETLDPHAETPYICRFEKGTGRHAKDGVRIGIAELSGTWIVALPGPNSEVQISLEELVNGLSEKLNKSQLAERIAACLREKLRTTMKSKHAGHSHRRH